MITGMRPNREHRETKTVDDLKAKGVEFSGPVTDRGWGFLTAITIPGGGTLGLYEPKHPTAIGLGDGDGEDAVAQAPPS